ncbi:MAG TPA: BamA/TamA family outer membrane protein [Gemmatimonadales bacterium]|nr:BamA/TamA family outer membrane protein [Gemmatimonadales bacterium]
MNATRATVIGLVLMASPGMRLAGQEPDTVPQEQKLQAAAPRYKANGLHRFLFGPEYRSLWSTPISVPVLDLRTFGGGLKAVSKGGGQQTKSLLLTARDGREFFFRSVDKDPSATLPLELRSTVAGDVVRDQTSSALPTAPLVVGPLLDAAGILHGKSRLYVLPDDSLLGEFRPEFTGLMGFLEDRVGGSRSVPAHWGGATEIIDSDSLLARMARGPDDRAEVRLFLTARLFDLLIGDWDRHAGQWSWARFGNAVPRRWVPIPQDRDQAFAKYDGVLLSVARQTAPQLTNFGSGYPYLAGATWNGRDLDRRLLVELEWPVWESAAIALQSALNDQVINEAVRALPPEHYALAGAKLAASLRSRRDHLLKAARGYYDLLAKQVDVHATDAEDEASVTREPDGTLQVALSGPGQGGDSYFRRRFDPATKEVRLYLDGGDDRVIVRGGSGGPTLRVLGGEGQDRLVDSTRKGSERFYDDAGAPARTEGSESKVDRRPYTIPRKNPEAVPERDWGKRWTTSTTLSYGPDIGVLIGGGRTLTVYGFRKDPYASRHEFRAAFASGPVSYRVEYRGEFRRENSGIRLDLLARASGIDVITFSGFGNDNPAPGNTEFYRVTQDAYRLQPSVVFALGSRATMRLGPVLRYVSTDNQPDRFLATLGDLYGTGNFGELGGGLSLRYDSRDRPALARKGLLLELGGDAYPAIWDVDSAYGEVRGEAVTYLSINAPLDPTLALRVGGRKLWGQYPFFDAAFIGGASTVRLGRENRYAGDASAYGSTELRLSLARIKLVLPARIGIFGLADAGRVFLAGETSDTWHAAGGGGVSLSFLEHGYTISLAIAQSEERTGVYLQGGFAF